MDVWLFVCDIATMEALIADFVVLGASLFKNGMGNKGAILSQPGILRLTWRICIICL